MIVVRCFQVATKSSCRMTDCDADNAGKNDIDPIWIATVTESADCQGLKELMNVAAQIKNFQIELLDRLQGIE